jgi:hypothetical protein
VSLHAVSRSNGTPWESLRITTTRARTTHRTKTTAARVVAIRAAVTSGEL